MSIGVAIRQNAADGADPILRRADAALYEAKRRGRNCMVTFDQELSQLAAGQ